MEEERKNKSLYQTDYYCCYYDVPAGCYCFNAEAGNSGYASDGLLDRGLCCGTEPQGLRERGN